MVTPVYRDVTVTGELIVNEGPLLMPDGTLSAPSFAYSDDTNTGIFSNIDGQLDITCDGTLAATFATGQILLPDGTEGAPSLSFTTDPDNGLRLAAANDLRIVGAGLDRLKLITNRLIFRDGVSLEWGSSGVSAVDLIVLRDSSNTLAQRNSTSAQTFNLYSTFTNASNYERLAVKAPSAADIQLVPEAAGTGTLRGLQLSSSSGRLGFFGTTAIAKPTVTGSRAGNAALADLLTELANLGILTDSSTA